MKLLDLFNDTISQFEYEQDQCIYGSKLDALLEQLLIEIKVSRNELLKLIIKKEV